MSATLVPLGQVASLRAGVGFPLDLQGRSTGKYPVAKVGDISRGGRSGQAVLATANHYVDDTDLERLGTQPIPTGSVLFAKIGEAIRQNHRVIAGCPMLIDNNAMAAVPGPDIESRYLFHFLRTVDFYSLTSSTTVPALRKSELGLVPIPLPPLEEQRRIAGILDRADALREQRRKALSGLDTLTRAIFVDILGSSRSRGWPKVALPHAYWFQEGPGVRKWQFKSAGVKLLNVGNIESGGSLNLLKTDRYVAEDEAFGKYRHFLVDAGDLVIASSGISFDADGLLRTRGAFVGENHLPLCMNTSTIRFKAIEQLSDLRWLWAWLDSREFRAQITRLVTGSAQQNFGPSHLSTLVITLPPLEVQRHFARSVAAIQGLRAVHLASFMDVEALFASLQHRAFRGKL